MAVLSDPDRYDIWADWMRGDIGSIAVSKVDLRAAFNALDDFMNTNAGAINAAIPQPARGALTTPQKASILVAVIRQRFIKGS